MGLARRARINGVFEPVNVNVWCIETKKIIFTGNQCEVGNLLGVKQGQILTYLKTKSRFRKKYALRLAKSK